VPGRVHRLRHQSGGLLGGRSAPSPASPSRSRSAAARLRAPLSPAAGRQGLVIFPMPDSTMTCRRMLSDVVHGLL
jgi:hypothetical protein